MEVYTRCKNGLLSKRPVVFSLGVFDGVHLGHQHLLALGKQRALESDALFAVMTFSNLLSFFSPPEALSIQLTTSLHKRKLLQQAGVDILVEVPFSEELKACSASSFLDLISKMFHIHTWVGGEDLCFGRDCEGNTTYLFKWASDRYVETVFVPRITAFGEDISSTRIRRLVSAGEFSQAGALLGRPYSIKATCSPVDTKDDNGSFGSYRLNTPFLCTPPSGMYAAKAALGEEPGLHDVILCVRENNHVEVQCAEPNNSVRSLPVLFTEVIPHSLIRPSQMGEESLLFLPRTP